MDPAGVSGGRSFYGALPAAVASALASRDVEAGDRVFRQGDLAGLIRLEPGRVRLIRHTPDGAALTLFVAGPAKAV